jgi:hypothetical protein
MRRTAGVMVLSLGMVVLGASSALARGDGWQPQPTSPDSEVVCPGGTVAAHVTMNKEFFRTKTLADGTVLVTVTGALKYRLTNEATGQSIIVGASGPSVGPWVVQLNPNGDVIFQAVGRNLGFLSPDQAAATGMPAILLTSGPIRVRIAPDGTLTFLRLPHHQVDLCAELGAG